MAKTVFAILALAVCATAITEVDVLNFALNLECLEGDFYSAAAYGYGLSTADRGGGPLSIGGKKANLTADGQYYAEQIAQDEIAHVRFLRAALGSAAVPCPSMDLGPAFSAAADAAFGMTLPNPYTPYLDDTHFLIGAFIFEDVGVTAYHGALGALTTPAYIAAGSGIGLVEAYHAGVVRTKLYEIENTFVARYGVTVGTIVDAVAALRDSVDGSTVDDDGIAGNATLIPADVNAIAYSRTPTQVLDIVYLGSAAKPGGFFPNGLNGAIR